MEWLISRLCSNYDKIIYFILVFLAGAFFSVFLNFVVGFEDKVELSFDLGSLMAVVVSVLLALHVTTRLSKTSEENRYIKNLAIKRLSKLEIVFIKKVKQIITTPNVYSVIKITNNLRKRVQDDIALFTTNNITPGSCHSLDRLQEGVEELWYMFSGDVSEVVFDHHKSEFVMSSEVRDHLFTILSDVSKAIFETQLEINAK